MHNKGVDPLRSGTGVPFSTKNSGICYTCVTFRGKHYVMGFMQVSNETLYPLLKVRIDTCIKISTDTADSLELLLPLVISSDF